MKNLRRTSNIIQVFLFVSFFLPFFKSCNTNAEEQKKREEELLYSRKSITQKFDSSEAVYNTVQKNVSVKEPATKDKLRIPDQKMCSNLTDTLCENSKTFSTLLKPQNNYSGIGYMLDYFNFYFLQFGILTTFILFLQSLIIRLISLRKFLLPCLILNTTGLVFLILTKPVTILFEEVTLWGYITCLVIYAVSIAFDIFLYISLRNIIKQADYGHAVHEK